MTRRRKILISIALVVGLVCPFTLLGGSLPANALHTATIIIDGKVVESDMPPQIINNRTVVPARAICEALGMNVFWDQESQTVIITSPVVADDNGSQGKVYNADQVLIMGESVASSAELKALLKKNNPQAPDLVDLYLSIGREYGVRGDLAFCQAAKETGWWRFGNLVKPYQNNYCGLGATGRPAAESEDLRGADPSRVWFEEGQHGAFFKTPADGVEAHIQHLYAYATTRPLPAGKSILDPRFTLVSRGIASVWSDLDGKWAVPGIGYGQSILSDYFSKALNSSRPLPAADRIKQLEEENRILKLEIERLTDQLDRAAKY